MKRRDFVAASIGASLSPTLGEARAAGTAAEAPATIFDAQANPIMTGCSPSTARRLEE